MSLGGGKWQVTMAFSLRRACLLIGAVGALWSVSTPLAAQAPSGESNETAPDSSSAENAELYDEIDALFNSERFDEGFAKADQLLILEQQRLGHNHQSVLRMLAQLTSVSVRSKDPARASAYLSQLVDLVPSLSLEDKARAETELDRACSTFQFRLLRDKTYVAPDQLFRCGVAFHGDMVVIFNDRINALVEAGRSSVARREVERRFEQLEQISGEPFSDNLEQAEGWTMALAVTGTKAFELNLMEISDRMYRRARDFADQYLPDDNPIAATTKATLANRLDARGEHYSAQVLHREAWETLVAAGQSDSLIGMAWANNYGRNQILLKRYDRAAELFKLALDVGRSELGGEDPTYLSIMSSYVLALYRSGQTDLANEIVGEAADYAQRLLEDPERFSADDPYKKGLFFMLFLGNMGVAELDDAILQGDKRDASRAQELIDRAHEGLVRLVGEDDDLSVAFAVNRANGLIYNGTEPALAQSLARGAFEVWEDRQSRFGLQEQDFDTQVEAKTMSRFYAYTVLDAFAATPDPLDPQEPDAITFRAMQWLGKDDASAAVAREFAINAAAREGEELKQLVLRREAISEEWIQNEVQIRESYSSLEDDILERREALTAQNLELSAEFDRIDARIVDEFPAYYSITRGQPLSPQAARELMRDDEATLVIAPSSRGTHIALVTSEAVDWTYSELTAVEIGQMVRRLKWYLGSDVMFDPADDLSFLDQVENQGPLPYDFATALRLYEQLIAPFEDHLRDKSHLFVADSGPIGTLPLGVLVSAIPEGPPGEIETLRNASWFSDDIAIIKIASLRALEFQRRFRANERPGELQDFLGFGAPLLEGEAASRGGLNRAANPQVNRAGSAIKVNGVDVDGKPSIDRNTLLAMARLPGTERELRAISQLFGAENSAVWLGDQATEEAFKATEFEGVDVLVLATHGLTAGEVDGLAEPGLVFTPLDRTKSVEDGFLSASEIVGLRIAVDWVILSACNTAAGNGSDESSALSGLARSFLFAGATNLLVSHWPVADAVAPELTVRTIELLRENPSLSRAQAFQQATIEVRNRAAMSDDLASWAHPNAWAPFSLVGDR